jgi:hypothetical protein
VRNVGNNSQQAPHPAARIRWGRPLHVRRDLGVTSGRFALGRHSGPSQKPNFSTQKNIAAAFSRKPVCRGSTGITGVTGNTTAPLFTTLVVAHHLYTCLRLCPNATTRRLCISTMYPGMMLGTCHMTLGLYRPWNRQVRTNGRRWLVLG